MDKSKTKIKKIKRKKFIKYEISKIINNSLDKMKDDIDKLDKIIPGRYKGYLVSKGKEEMFYSNVFVEDLLKKEFDKHLDDGKVVI